MKQAPRWTLEETATLRERYLQGNSIYQMMEALPVRTYEAISTRIKILGLGVEKGAQGNMVRKRVDSWTTQEDAILRDGYRDGLSPLQLEKLLPRRTTNAISVRASILHLRRPTMPKPAAPKATKKPRPHIERENGPAPHTHWSVAEDAILKEACEAGEPASKIAERLPGRSCEAVLARIIVRDLPRVARPRNAVAFRAWERTLLSDCRGFSLVEIKMLLPTRSTEELRELARMVGFELPDERDREP
jgi:hypothetical protein